MDPLHRLPDAAPIFALFLTISLGHLIGKFKVARFVLGGITVSREAIRLWCIKFGAIRQKIEKKPLGLSRYLLHRRSLREDQRQVALLVAFGEWSRVVT